MDFIPTNQDQEFLTKHNLGYTEMHRIPPERLITKKPTEYDYSLRNHDIDGAYAIIKKQNPYYHNNSLRTDDITGAQPKKSIRNIWGEYDYNPLAKQLEKRSQILPSGNPARNPLFYSSQAMAAEVKNLETNFVPQDPHSTLENKSANPKWLEQRYHVQKIEPKSQLKEQNIMNPPEYSQQEVDYDKIVQPYQKPIRDSQLVQKLQEKNQLSQIKNYDVPEKMKQYQKTQNQLHQYDSQLLNEVSNKNKQNDQYAKNYENFYRGYTPNQNSQFHYDQTSKLLQQKSQDISQKAKNIEQNIFQDPLAYNQNQSKFFGVEDKIDLKKNQERFYEDQAAGGQRNMGHSQSVQQFSSAVFNRNEKKPWSKYEYNLIGNYPKEKRYMKSSYYNNQEVKYYQNYDPVKQSQLRKYQKELQNNYAVESQPGYQKNKEQFFGSQDAKGPAVRQNELDFNSVNDYQQYRQQKDAQPALPDYTTKQPEMQAPHAENPKQLRNQSDANFY